MTFIEEVFAFFYRPNEKQRADIPRGHRLAMLLMQVFHSLPLLKLAYCHLRLQGLCYWGHARSDKACHADGGQTFLLPRSCSIGIRAIV